MELSVALAVALAAGLDLAVGEPPTRWHPVARFGSVVSWGDRAWSRPMLAGIGIALVLPLLAAVAVWATVRLAGTVAPALEILAAGVALFVTTSLRALVAAVTTVIEESERDPDAARASMPTLVGRDPEGLGPGHIRSGAVESAGENLADGLVGPLLAFALLGPIAPALGAAGAAWVKAVNTLDSMLGYPDRPVGTASARLDDLVMWVPARVAAGCLALVAVRPMALVSARRLAHRTASPNAGWPMATVAVLTGVCLEKPGAYRLDGGRDLPDVPAAYAGVRLVRRAGFLAIGLAIGWGLVVGFR